jgi:hypothetical protein
MEPCGLAVVELEHAAEALTTRDRAWSDHGGLGRDEFVAKAPGADVLYGSAAEVEGIDSAMFQARTSGVASSFIVAATYGSEPKRNTVPG